jgi:hypothetical protein
LPEISSSGPFRTPSGRSTKGGSTFPKKLDDYHAANIVPGHGPVQQDYEYVHHVAAMLDSLNKQAREGVQQGLTDDQLLAKIDLPADRRRSQAMTKPFSASSTTTSLLQAPSARSKRRAKGGSPPSTDDQAIYSGAQVSPRE